MDGFQAFKYYLAVKLHFTNPKFNLKENKGKLKCSRDSFEARNDKFLFEKLAREFKSDQQYIRYIASNFMYGHHDVIYSPTKGRHNFLEYTRRREAITNMFCVDLLTIADEKAQYNWSGSSVPDVVKLYLKGDIMLETLVILDSLEGIVEKMRNGLSSYVLLLLGDDLLRIERARMFVKFDPIKVSKPYQKFQENITVGNITYG